MTGPVYQTATSIWRCTPDSRFVIFRGSGTPQEAAKDDSVASKPTFFRFATDIEGRRLIVDTGPRDHDAGRIARILQLG